MQNWCRREKGEDENDDTDAMKKGQKWATAVLNYLHGKGSRKFRRNLVKESLPKKKEADFY